MTGNISDWQVFSMELGYVLSLEERRINRLGKEAENKLTEDRICVCVWVEKVGVCGLVLLADEFMSTLIEVIGGIRH